jgi:hypothetical protein
MDIRELTSAIGEKAGRRDFAAQLTQSLGNDTVADS